MFDVRYESLLLFAGSIDWWSRLFRLLLSTHGEESSAENRTEGGHGKLTDDTISIVFQSRSRWMAASNAQMTELQRRGKGRRAAVIAGLTYNVRADLPAGNCVHGDHLCVCMRSDAVD